MMPISQMVIYIISNLKVFIFRIWRRQGARSVVESAEGILFRSDFAEINKDWAAEIGSHIVSDEYKR